MVTSDVLDWGLHLSKEEQSLNQAELTELINKGAKVQFVDVDSVTKLMEVTAQLPTQKKSKR